jgi:DNA processing protein
MTPGEWGLDRRARAALSRLAEPEDKGVHTLVANHGPVETVRRIRALEGRLDRFAERVRRLDVERDAAIAARVGARLVVPGDDEWPEGLDDLPIPPWCLWVRGAVRVDEAVRRSVAVVGARAATSYGDAQASEIAAGLAMAGWSVVSGAAYGIDGAAHRGALAVDGLTVAVLACGVDRVYPAAHAQLLQRIAETGCVVSEVAPGSAPMGSRFLSRNRLIAAMTAGTVVVEAGLRSGSLQTMNRASQLNRPVGAVPGPVTSMTSAGCHNAIRNRDAMLVTNAAEVIELVGRIGEGALAEPREEGRPEDHLAPDEARVHQSLPRSGAIDLDALLSATALAPMVVLAALTRLEEGGLAVKKDGGWRKIRRRDP